MRSFLCLAALAVAVAGCDSIGDDTVFVSYTGPEITEADALVDDGIDLRGWTVERRRDLLVLARFEFCGDECGRTLALHFEGERDGLPTSVYAEIARQELLPERYFEEDLAIDRVEIQDWGPTVYSGIAYPVPADAASTVPIVFWADNVAVGVDATTD